MAEADLAGLSAIARIRLGEGWVGRRSRWPGRGSQHNTMDIEYYGPNPEVQTWYLAALAAAAKMAEAAGDEELPKPVKQSRRRNAATEAVLFNGRYYRQKIIPPTDFSHIPSRLRHTNMGATNATDPEFQVGEGCVMDQLVGDTYAQVVGLPGVLDREHVRIGPGQYPRPELRA